MIPRADITAWRNIAPWPADGQVEQDLAISRAIVEIFSDPVLGNTVAFRGGTALHKLFLSSPERYSEDVDLVQVASADIGEVLTRLEQVLGSWLGRPVRKQILDTFQLTFRFETTAMPVESRRLQVEINTGEREAMLELRKVPMVVDSRWFSGRAEIMTYETDELLATKLRALYQRNKGRDLYDMWTALLHLDVDGDRVVDCFRRCLSPYFPGSRTDFEANLGDKLKSPAFRRDLEPLLRLGVEYDIESAAQLIRERIISRLPG